MLTREETIKIFETCRCGAGDCDDCPMECDGNGNGFDELSSAVLHYLRSDKENEPAPTAIGTSSEVSKDTGSILHIDDSTKEQICQTLKATKRAMEDIIDVYQAMPENEQKAFDLGQSYRVMLEVKKELVKVAKRR